MRQIMVLTVAVMVFLAPVAMTDTTDGLVAQWDFNEGEGSVLHDRHGENNGQIVGAQWVPCGNGHALRFDGDNDYVDCGDSPALDLRGPLTLQAWVKPSSANRGEPGIAGKYFESYALTYWGDAYFYISSGGNQVFGVLKMNTWTHVAGTFDGTFCRVYINGVEARCHTSKFKDVNPGNHFFIGCISKEPLNPPRAVAETGYFPGEIDSVRVHNRALSQAEILHDYNLEAAEKGLEPFDLNRLGAFALEPFFYPNDNRAVLSVNSRWALPLPEGAMVKAEFAHAGQDTLIQSVQINPHAPHFEDEAEFSLTGLGTGEYEFRVVASEDKTVLRTDSIRFQIPFPAPAQLPSPDTHAVPPLPPEIVPPEYELDMHEDGGFDVIVNKQVYRVESRYSYPHGGWNRLTAGSANTDAEKVWQVTSVKADQADTFQLDANGEYYSIHRVITRQPSRVLVKDTITNTSTAVVGIMLSNYLNLQESDSPQVTQMANPTIFASLGQSGAGLVALDDLYQLQQEHAWADGIAEIRTNHFGLNAGASYTLEWAIYPCATNDYYDFINQIRKDEGLNRRVEGAFAFVDRREPPSKESVYLKNLKYASVACLGFPPDDPTVSVEGFEFVNYPQECAALKKTFEQTKKMHPGIHVMFHVAHSLYTTNKPKELFPDSPALSMNGDQIFYGPDSLDYYGNYFSKERFEQGWRWWIFYPTSENRFGKAMIEAMDYMLNEIGATGMWADGYVRGYVPGGYSYDGWDGHSVTIDSDTKLVTKKKVCVAYAALPVLKKVAQMIHAKGGSVITNGEPGSRSLWNEDMIASCETAGGDANPVSALHLGRSVTPLGNQSAIENQRDVYRDILGKLDFGALYFWYGDRDLMRHKTLVEHMYPITFQSIHAGTVYGEERIITKKSGVYGWHGDNSLQVVYLYDARGVLIPNDFVSTVDKNGVRTEVVLKKDQSAAIVKTPVTLENDNPVNFFVSQYDEKEIRISLNGKGMASFQVSNGKFPVTSHDLYGVCLVNVWSSTTMSDVDTFRFGATLDQVREIILWKRKQ